MTDQKFQERKRRREQEALMWMEFMCKRGKHNVVFLEGHSLVCFCGAASTHYHQVTEPAKAVLNQELGQ